MYILLKLKNGVVIEVRARYAASDAHPNYTDASDRVIGLLNDTHGDTLAEAPRIMP